MSDTYPPLTLIVAHTNLRRDIAFRDSNVQEFLSLGNLDARTPTPWDLLTRVSLIDDSDLVRKSRIVIPDVVISSLSEFPMTSISR
jgi:hypothetical protein